MQTQLEVLTGNEIDLVHQASLDVLDKTGMKIEYEKLLQGLESHGAKVDWAAKTVRFPRALVERALANNRKLMDEGIGQHLLNGVTSEISGIEGMAAKVSGGCELYLDWETQSLREPDSDALLSFIRLGEMLPEVTFVGNPIVIRKDFDGNTLEERMRRIHTASLVAKNTRKVGSMEVWDEREIDFLVEIGTVVRGGAEKFAKRPCLVTAKETISPLFLDEKSGSILLALAERGLPCTIIPMPITGLSAPATKFGSVIIGNAEIIGVMTAIYASCPEAVSGGGTISGIVDMQTGSVSFSAPEAILQDLAISAVHEKLYGFNYLVGTGYTDAKYPNSQVLSEKALKFTYNYLSGRNSHPVGLLNGGSVFSPEQTLVDIEICRFIQAHSLGLGDEGDILELPDLIDAVGIRGNFLETEHTLEHFRDNWFPELFDRTGFSTLEESKRKEIYVNAHERYNHMLSGEDFYKVEPEAEREIDRIVASANETL